MKFNFNDTITALATPHGSGAIAVIRLSGKLAFSICEKFSYTKFNEPIIFSEKKGYTVHFAVIIEKGVVIDEVLMTVFKSPNLAQASSC